jgi:hypothetical protein
LLIEKLKETLFYSVRTSADLFKILIPISIFVKLLQEAGGIAIISNFLSPVMSIVGLPGALAVVWASCMLANIYTGIVVLATVSQGLTLSVAQMTILASMCLLAHTLPVEVAVARKAGVPAWFTTLWRVGGAILYGSILYRLYFYTGWLAEPASGFLIQPPADSSLWTWIGGELHRLLLIFVAIFGLHLLLDFLKSFGVTDLITRRCRRLLGVFGMSEQVAPLVLIGMLMGIVYGGGLIIAETKRHNLAPNEVFSAMSLLALLHAVIEDTAIMSLIGASLTGTLIGRVVFATIFCLILAQATKPRRQLLESSI